MTAAIAPDRTRRWLPHRLPGPAHLLGPAAAPTFPLNPTIYAIDAQAWLSELRQRRGARVSLATVPDDVWDELAEWGADAVWLKGVWARSPVGARIALDDPQLTAGFRRVLRDFSDGDVVGSASCIRAYEVDPRLGGRSGLGAARSALAERGIGLILDFVANHVAPDHPWAISHPSFFVRGDRADIARAPAEFLAIGDGVVARARSLFAAPWPDVLQLNAFDPGLRYAAAAVLSDIASQCDGVRCAASALVLNDVFARTWGSRVGPPPATEFWADVIGGVKASHPRFLFLGAADWDREWDLQQLGFDYCHDERLYDRLAHDRADAVRAHLRAEPAYQQRLARFVEPAGGPPAAAAFGLARHRAVVVAAATQMGARIFHDGQCEGRRRRSSRFLLRRPQETSDPALEAFYRRLLAALRLPPLRAGEWGLCECTGWPGNSTCDNLVTWRWRARDSWALVVVNLSGAPAQGRVHLSGIDVAAREWMLHDFLSGARYLRDGNELHHAGLYVDLPPWGYHLLVTGPTPPD